MCILNQAAATELTLLHNALLEDLIEAFPKENPGAVILPFDFFTAFNELLANATAEGIDTTTACYTVPTAEEFTAAAGRAGSVCSDPSKHIFWDEIHPTSWVHRYFGEMLAEMIRPMAVSYVSK